MTVKRKPILDALPRAAEDEDSQGHDLFRGLGKAPRSRDENLRSNDVSDYNKGENDTRAKLDYLHKVIDGLKELNDHKLRLVDEFIRSLAAAPAAPLPFPKEAPELYASRPDRFEKAPDFIRRVYGPWLTGDFTRADLRKLDPKAWAALNNWEQHQKRAADINLPTLKEKTRRQIEGSGFGSRNDAVREYDRLRKAAARMLQP